MNKITIKELNVFAYHGVLQEEKTLIQKFIVSTDIFFDFGKAAENDDLNMSINYAQVCQKIVEFLSNNTFSLIETAAYKLVRHLFLCFPLSQKINLELKKPEAPLGMPIGYVSATVEEKRHTAYLALGSNMGDRKANILYAVKRLRDDEMCKVISLSDIYETSPVGVTEQNDFLNAAIIISTLYSPNELLKKINGIEKESGRERTEHWGPRTLDIDIIFYDDIKIHSDELTIPHAEAMKRAFVVIPMSTVAPFYIHPVFGKSMIEEAEKYDIYDGSVRKLCPIDI